MRRWSRDGNRSSRSFDCDNESLSAIHGEHIPRHRTRIRPKKRSKAEKIIEFNFYFIVWIRPLLMTFLMKRARGRNLNTSCNQIVHHLRKKLKHSRATATAISFSKIHIKALISVINRRKDNNCRSATSSTHFSALEPLHSCIFALNCPWLDYCFSF